MSPVNQNTARTNREGCPIQVTSAPEAPNEGRTAPFRTGDGILHRPSGETWACALTDPQTGYLSWLGWPPVGRALIADCESVAVARDETHREWLRELKKSRRRDAARALRLYGDPNEATVLREPGSDEVRR
jgi:hypothetical protein